MQYVKNRFSDAATEDVLQLLAEADEYTFESERWRSTNKQSKM